MEKSAADMLAPCGCGGPVVLIHLGPGEHEGCFFEHDAWAIDCSHCTAYSVESTRRNAIRFHNWNALPLQSKLRDMRIGKKVYEIKEKLKLRGLNKWHYSRNRWERW